MKQEINQIISLSTLLLLTLSVNGAELGTRQSTIRPRAVPPGTQEITASNVVNYATYGYSAWDWGVGADEGQKFNLMPEGYSSATNVARLLSFFSISDIHLTDKESPAQVPYLGWTATFTNAGPGNLNPSAYSPVILDTTFRLDSAIRTINAVNQLTPFHFGIELGDVCNAGQYNELHWFLDVMDGKWIIPSSGNHAGAETIDYQKPFQAAGLDSSIPWYAVAGNHDLMWMGIGYPSSKVQAALVGSNILNRSSQNSPLIVGADGSGMYVGTVDGSTPYGDVIKFGATNLYDKTPVVATDQNRHFTNPDITWSKNFVSEFTNSTSLPAGHGFNLSQTGSLAACYWFLPKADIPIKVIVLDTACKLDIPGKYASFYGAGWVDSARYTWLTNELNEGQVNDQLMIIACHVPIKPMASLSDTNRVEMFYVSDNPTPGLSEPPTNFPGCKTEDELIASLHDYPNLIMVIAGHRHVNVVTPFPSPNPANPEKGFWEIETPSMRDFPQQFRTYEILRNTDNSISILTTDVDPVRVPGTPSWKSLGYAIGARRLYGLAPLDDTSSQTYNAELVVALTPKMQSVIASSGSTLGHQVSIDCNVTNLTVNFLGTLKTTDNLSQTWTDVTNISPYIVSEPTMETTHYYRAVE